jgi:drug/metabolite transporter (DMT)-like permease
LLSYQAIFVGLLAGVPMSWLWVTPEWTGLGLMVGIGLVSSVGQWLGVRALRAGEASLVAGVEYMKLIYATILGYWLFSEWPDMFTLVGAVLIIGSALFTIHREARKRHPLEATVSAIEKPPLP